jgi:hypothetical protein
MVREVKQLASASNRSQRRQSVSKTGIIVQIGGKIRLPCHVSDMSENGALIRLSSSQGIPNQSLFIDVENRAVHHAEVAWRKTDRVGLKLTRRMSLSNVPQELAYLRVIWLEYAAR